MLDTECMMIKYLMHVDGMQEAWQLPSAMLKCLSCEKNPVHYWQKTKAKRSSVSKHIFKSGSVSNSNLDFSPVIFAHSHMAGEGRERPPPGLIGSSPNVIHGATSLPAQLVQSIEPSGSGLRPPKEPLGDHY